MIGIDIFSGAGGMTLGAKLAGIDIWMSVELDPWAWATYSANNPSCIALQTDVGSVKNIRIPNPSGKSVVLFGGPPCQGFSTSNQKTRNASNPKNWMFQEFFNVVSALQPDWVVFENVAGILETEGGVFVDQILESFRSLKYRCASGLLNSADFGVPQVRRRFFIVARRGAGMVSLPTPSMNARISVAEAIADLPTLENGDNLGFASYSDEPPSEFAKLMRGKLQECDGHLVSRNADSIVERYSHIPPGGNWEDIPEHMMSSYTDRTRCHTGIYRRLSPDSPSVVIGNYRKNMLIHPSQNRGLSVREAARLQSFPDWYRFKGSIGFQQQQVGNAVPPLLAAAVFKHVATLAGLDHCQIALDSLNPHEAKELALAPVAAGVYSRNET